MVDSSCSSYGYASLNNDLQYGEDFYIYIYKGEGGENYEVSYTLGLYHETAYEMDMSQTTTVSFYGTRACTEDYNAPDLTSFTGQTYLDAGVVDLTFDGMSDGTCKFYYALTLSCDNSCGLTE